MKDVNFNILEGKIINSIELTKSEKNKGDEIIFVISDTEKYRMFHYQDCCENVTIDDIVGDLSDLIGSPITLAHESCSGSQADKDNYGSETWTFYKLATIKGYVDIKWFGESNGYYSESVDFEFID